MVVFHFISRQHLKTTMNLFRKKHDDSKKEKKNTTELQVQVTDLQAEMTMLHKRLASMQAKVQVQTVAAKASVEEDHRQASSSAQMSSRNTQKNHRDGIPGSSQRLGRPPQHKRPQQRLTDEQKHKKPPPMTPKQQQQQQQQQQPLKFSGKEKTKNTTKLQQRSQPKEQAKERRVVRRVVRRPNHSKQAYIGETVLEDIKVHKSTRKLKTVAATKNRASLLSSIRQRFFRLRQTFGHRGSTALLTASNSVSPGTPTKGTAATSYHRPPRLHLKQGLSRSISKVIAPRAVAASALSEKHKDPQEPSKPRPKRIKIVSKKVRTVHTAGCSSKNKTCPKEKGVRAPNDHENPRPTSSNSLQRMQEARAQLEGRQLSPKKFTLLPVESSLYYQNEISPAKKNQETAVCPRSLFAASKPSSLSRGATARNVQLLIDHARKQANTPKATLPSVSPVQQPQPTALLAEIRKTRGTIKSTNRTPSHIKSKAAPNTHAPELHDLATMILKQRNAMKSKSLGTFGGLGKECVTSDCETASTLDDSSSSSDGSFLPMTKEPELPANRGVPQYLVKQNSIVTKWNKFAAMEENGIGAAPRHRTKVVQALRRMGETTAAATAATANNSDSDSNTIKNPKPLGSSPLRTNLLGQIRQQDHALRPIKISQEPAQAPKEHQTSSIPSTGGNRNRTYPRPPLSSADFLAGIQAGISLKKTEAVVSKQEAAKVSKNPANDIFAGIRAGVHLKRVEKPTNKATKANKNQQSSTSALLAKLQARKQECLRKQQQQQQHRGGSSCENNEDDW